MTLILDENDSILESIKLGMKEHGVKEVTVEGMEGTLKEGIGSYMEGSRFMTKNFANDDVFNASGKYKLQVDQLWGNLHVIVNQKSPLNVTLVKGKSAQGLIVNLSFIEFVDIKAQTETKTIEPELTTTAQNTETHVQEPETQTQEKTFTVDELNQQVQTQ